MVGLSALGFVGLWQTTQNFGSYRLPWTIAWSGAWQFWHAALVTTFLVTVVLKTPAGTLSKVAFLYGVDFVRSDIVKRVIGNPLSCIPIR